MQTRRLRTPFTTVKIALAGLLAVPAASTATAGSVGPFDLAAQQPKRMGDVTASRDTEVYIVRLVGPSVATYEGGIAGLAATSPHVTGAVRLDVQSPASRAYARHLKDQQTSFLAACKTGLGRAPEVVYEYCYALNGMALRLTASEAKAVARLPNVESVAREEMRMPTTDAGPRWIGAPAIWNGATGLPGTKGEGMVIAVLDTGINHDHPSFADVGGDGYDHSNPLGSGNYIPGSYCDTTDGGFCNDKLIGAWGLVRGPRDPTSPEDSDSHGSHTTGTAAGNVLPTAALQAPTATLTSAISGVAPHANIIMYDVCIVSCPSSALIAAVNQVVIDAAALPNGIHALNFSISGGADPYDDNVELGFLGATAAGIYVSASAGNSGPGAATTSHNSPWVSTPAASTHNRSITNGLLGLLSDGTSLADIAGAGFTSGYGPARIVHARDFPTQNGSANDFEPGQCLEEFPAGHFSGEIVVCDRGTIARVQKGINVLVGGAGGMVLANIDGQGESAFGDAHFLPAVHIGFAGGERLRNWLVLETGTTAIIMGAALSLDPANGDIMADFSSRGPNLSIAVLKPDLTAPGVDVWAATADGSAPPPEFALFSGTSMSSPHNAGAGALLRAVRPQWSPYAIKSALMMTAVTANTRKEDGVTPADPFDLGAGRVAVDRAAQSGLVLNETPTRFLAANPAKGGNPKTLNIASMQDNACLGECEWTRTVTNVTGKRATWSLSTQEPAGVKMSIRPRSKITLAPGESGAVSIAADTALAAPGWNFARLALVPERGGPHLHMPIAVNAVTSTRPTLLSNLVDFATASEGDVLTYAVSITNGQLTDVIHLDNVLPAGVDFIRGSEMAIIAGGTTTTPFSGRGRNLSWSGTLDEGGFQVAATPSPFGYIPLALFGIPPFGCPADCDDGGVILNVPAFRFNGVNYNQVLWSVNGTLEAGATSGVAASPVNRRLPDTASPNNLMAALWMDLDMGVNGDGAEWYVAVASAGPNQYTIYEWANIPRFGDPTQRYSFQIWVQNGAAGNVWYVYERLGDVAGTSVGVENATGTVGSSYFFRGAGTPPVARTDLGVKQLVGGTATFTFQARVEECEDRPLVNRANITSGATAEAAIAVTACLDDDDDDDDHDGDDHDD